MNSKNIRSWVLAAGFVLIFLISISVHSVSCPDDGDRLPSMVVPTGDPGDGDLLPSGIQVPAGNPYGGDVLPSYIFFEALT